jgi:hypothetical protein
VIRPVVGWYVTQECGCSTRREFSIRRPFHDYSDLHAICGDHLQKLYERWTTQSPTNTK